jgi:hypothetical protein
MAANTTGSADDTAHALVSIDLQADLPIGNADRTIELWMYVKPTDWVAEKNEIYVYGTVGASLQQVGLDFGAPAVQGMPGNHATLGPYTDGTYDDDTGKYLGIDSAASQWVHVAMTWDGLNTTLRTYVNGTLRITTKNTAKLITNQSPFYLGCNPPYYGCFNGLFDELRVWKVLRTDAEIMAAYNKALVGNEPGLVGYWKFNEEPGSLIAADSVTTPGHTAHPGTLLAAMPANVPTFVTPDPLPPVACPEVLGLGHARAADTNRGIDQVLGRARRTRGGDAGERRGREVAAHHGVPVPPTGAAQLEHVALLPKLNAHSPILPAMSLWPRRASPAMIEPTGAMTNVPPQAGLRRAALGTCFVARTVRVALRG